MVFPHVLSDSFRANISLGRDVSDDAIWQALARMLVERPCAP
ncbi:hypothetical protein [Grimontia hollisae]|nr:hypothetical protein [Grimontia hollisae]